MTAVAFSRRLRTSKAITEECLRHAERMRYRDVTISGLCEACGVSERRVRHAFYDCFGMAPTAYLRALALHEVRRALLDGPMLRDAVTRVASDHGFQHLSRFAGQYRALFGEYPSDTVARATERRAS